LRCATKAIFVPSGDQRSVFREPVAAMSASGFALPSSGASINCFLATKATRFPEIRGSLPSPILRTAPSRSEIVYTCRSRRER